MEGEEETPALAQWLQQHAVTICCSRWTRYPGNCIKAEGASTDGSGGLFSNGGVGGEQCAHPLLAGKITWPYSAKSLPGSSTETPFRPSLHPGWDPPTGGLGRNTATSVFCGESVSTFWDKSQVVETTPDGGVTRGANTD